MLPSDELLAARQAPVELTGGPTATMVEASGGPTLTRAVAYEVGSVSAHWFPAPIPPLRNGTQRRVCGPAADTCLQGHTDRPLPARQALPMLIMKRGTGDYKDVAFTPESVVDSRRLPTLGSPPRVNPVRAQLGASCQNLAQPL